MKIGARIWRMGAVITCAVLGITWLVADTPRVSFDRFLPEQDFIRTRMDVKTQLLLYAPPGEAIDGAAVLLFSGNGGWRPLMQDIGSFLATQGRYVLGIDSTQYFNRRLRAREWLSELAILREFVNKKAGRRPKTPISLVGFTFGAEMIPYIVNRAGAKGVAGAVLLAPDQDGLLTFSITAEVEESRPPQDRFDVAEEIKKMPPLPVVLMEGSLDGLSEARSLYPLLTGPRKYAPIMGANRQFMEERDLFLTRIGQALEWIDSDPPRPSPEETESEAPASTSPRD